MTSFVVSTYRLAFPRHSRPVWRLYSVRTNNIIDELRGTATTESR